MKAWIIAVCMSTLIISNAFATAQAPDKIIYNGKEYALHTNPMESYFSKYPDKRPEVGFVSSALWRGYVATFEFKEKMLVLKDIEIEVSKENSDGEFSYKWVSVKDKFVPDGDVLQIDWFTGLLVLPYGELVNYVHLGYGSTYNNYILLEIKNGKFTGERNFDCKRYEQFREKQFQAFKKTEAYKNCVEELREEGDSQEFIDSFIRSFIVDYTSEFLNEEESSK